MSEEVSSSTATSGKHPRKEEDGETEEVSQAKRQRLDEDGESGPYVLLQQVKLQCQRVQVVKVLVGVVRV
jgi:hypothetical protein